MRAFDLPAVWVIMAGHAERGVGRSLGKWTFR
ncbi:hypothetical protein PDIG_77100 [Penicillium digitatum PHI26]|uniref:Uncharacterized protein n=2 Tax=Penicillium digitatum TaxID=36651 RepID=K9FUT4_PEND2|nr:hypothetical protein PDIP_04220 [Penicillium digitatum Pd1]EKV06513.1 hypothetical protein PDIG_77100 [Penicillium digitatum PHI26]EKV21680.1 hypothetical protein PDIP_04220 [Penicillium digitatum Pd1]